jgi:hypothetical protein
VRSVLEVAHQPVRSGLAAISRFFLALPRPTAIIDAVGRRKSEISLLGGNSLKSPWRPAELAITV